MICAACHREMHPVGHLIIGRGIVNRCPLSDCGAQVVEPDPQEAAPEAAADVEPAPLAERSRIRARPAAPAGPSDVVALARERLDFVRAVIAELRAYEREERQLVAMVAAAEMFNEPSAYSDGAVAHGAIEQTITYSIGD